MKYLKDFRDQCYIKTKIVNSSYIEINYNKQLENTDSGNSLWKPLRHIVGTVG